MCRPERPTLSIRPILHHWKQTDGQYPSLLVVKSHTPLQACKRKGSGTSIKDQGLTSIQKSEIVKLQAAIALTPAHSPYITVPASQNNAALCTAQATFITQNRPAFPNEVPRVFYSASVCLHRDSRVQSTQGPPSRAAHPGCTVSARANRCTCGFCRVSTLRCSRASFLEMWRR
jgi:hypothetical protein